MQLCICPPQHHLGLVSILPSCMKHGQIHLPLSAASALVLFWWHLLAALQSWPPLQLIVVVTALLHQPYSFHLVYHAMEGLDPSMLSSSSCFFHYHCHVHQCCCQCCFCCHVSNRALAAMQGIYRPRQRAGSGPPEGEAFFFRTSCFELLKSCTIRCHIVLASPISTLVSSSAATALAALP